MAPLRVRYGSGQPVFTVNFVAKSPTRASKQQIYKAKNNIDRKYDPRHYPLPNINLNSTLNGELMYEITDLDEACLEMKQPKGILLSKPDFADVMQILDEESSFKIIRLTPEVVFCAICLQDDGDSDHIFCDLCDIVVHIHCYGVPFVPDNQWLCRKCELCPTGRVHCALCLKTGGAFKTTVNHEAYPWIHVACAHFHPRVEFLNESCKEPANFKLSLLTSKNNATCVICKKEGGACIRCSHKWCRRGAFHVSCALETKGFSIVFDEKMIFCEQHTPQDSSCLVMDGTCDVYANKPVVYPSVNQSTRDKIRDRTRITDSDLIAQIERQWLLRRIFNHGLPLNSRSNLPLKIDVDEIEEPMEEEDFMMEVDDIRNEVIQARNLVEDANATVNKIVRSPNALENFMDEFNRHVLPPSVHAFMERLLNIICSWDVERTFAEPVDGITLENYTRIIKYPMDLKTMRQKLYTYWSVEDLEADFTLMVNNCIRFSGPESVFGIEANRLRELSIPLFRQAKIFFQQL